MNKVILIGNLTRDPELKTTPNGVSVCQFSIAVSRRYTDKSGERQTDYFNIVAWRGLGENCGRYLAKGRKVGVTGELQTRSYEKDGVKHYITEIIADDVEFLTPKEGGGARSSEGGAPYAAAKGEAPAQDVPFTDMEGDDELPF